MRAAVWQAPRTLVQADLDEPVAQEGQAVIAVAYAGVCGSDLHAHDHGYGVRSGQVLGHEFSGRVVSAPAVDGLHEGQRVAVRPVVPCGICDRCAAAEVQRCDAPVERFIGFTEPGAFAEQVLVPVAVAGGTVFPLPDAVDDRAGALVEPLAVSLRAVTLAGDVTGATVLVLGAGMIGLGVVRLLHLAGVAHIAVADPSASRRGRAQALGASVVIDPVHEDPVAVLRGITGPWLQGRGARADLVVECAGATGTLATALDATRQGGTVVVAAMGRTQAEIRPDVIATKELTVRGSLTYREEFGQVIDLLADGVLDAEVFTSHTVGLDRIDQAFALQRDTDASLKVLVTPLAGAPAAAVAGGDRA